MAVGITLIPLISETIPKDSAFLVSYKFVKVIASEGINVVATTALIISPIINNGSNELLKPLDHRKKVITIKEKNDKPNDSQIIKVFFFPILSVRWEKSSKMPST